VRTLHALFGTTQISNHQTCRRLCRWCSSSSSRSWNDIGSSSSACCCCWWCLRLLLWVTCRSRSSNVCGRYFWGATWDSWKSHLLLMRLAASTKFLTRLIGFSPWIMAPWTPHFRNHQLPCFWHETIPVRSADHEVVARYHGSRRHFVRLVLWARPMIFGGKGKAEITGRAGYYSHVIYVYMN
jgi:hypothetical protein